jgi:hypothetical protein
MRAAATAGDDPPGALEEEALQRLPLLARKRGKTFLRRVLVLVVAFLSS